MNVNFLENAQLDGQNLRSCSLAYLYEASLHNVPQNCCTFYSAWAELHARSFLTMSVCHQL